MGGLVVAGMLAGYGIAMPVGAITVLIVTLSARTSLPVGLAAAMGTATADGLYALVAVLTGSALANLLRPVAGMMRWAAAAVLILIALKGLMGAFQQSRSSSSAPVVGMERPMRAYLKLLGLTILNPLTVVYFSALVLALRNDTWSAVDGAVFVLAALAASASWQAVLAVGGTLVGRVLTGEKGRLATAIVGNGVIVLLAAHLLRA